jgi:alpha-L-fucosidase
MVDVPLRNHEWFWRPGDDRKVYTPDSLIEIYYNSVGRNCNLLIGTTPDIHGRIPDADCSAGAAFGKEIKRRFSQVLSETKGNGRVLNLQLKRPARIDHISVMEDIALGERIRQYKLEGLTGAEQWTSLGEGESVGHKRIHRFPPIECAAVRLTVAKATGSPVISSLAVYAT